MGTKGQKKSRVQRDSLRNSCKVRGVKEGERGKKSKHKTPSVPRKRKRTNRKRTMKTQNAKEGGDRVRFG